MSMFPKDFVWGVSTASYQIEGAVKEDGRGETIWDRFSHMPGRITDGANGDTACDSYHRLDEDIALLKKLGVKGYRFSVAWSRILPKGYGEVNEAGLSYYEKLIDACLEAEVEPFVTLYHWDLPQALQDEGGWMNRRTADYFEEYCRILFERFGKKVKHWMTLNEPWVVTFEGHYTGNFAPGVRDFSAALQAAHTLLLAHGKALKLFREMNLPGEIGIVLNLSPKAPLSDSEEDKKAAVRHDGFANRWFLDPIFCGKYPEDMEDWYRKHDVVLPKTEPGDFDLISAHVDFLGINYYNIDYSRNDPSAWPLEFSGGLPKGYPLTQYGWPITPDGIRQILMRVHEEYHPEKLYITENGISLREHPDRNGVVDDAMRIDYLDVHFDKVAEAIAEGCPLAGYFVWTLMDDFEWNTGFDNQFGLVSVDRKTMKRTEKKSFAWYHDRIEKESAAK